MLFVDHNQSPTGKTSLQLKEYKRKTTKNKRLRLVQQNLQSKLSLTSRYIHVTVNGNNTQCLNTKQIVTEYRISQELKLQYIKKQKHNNCISCIYNVHISGIQIEKVWSVNNVYNYKCICWFFFIKLALMHGMEHLK
jgi:glucose-6-phosphate-specific signal transduction histidine kinase